MKMRIKFAKTGVMKFVGHLDIMRYFQKAIRRAGIDIAYSGGFSPHQIMSFAAPLGVGLISFGEYFDIELNTPAQPEEIRERLDREMVPGIAVLAVTALTDKAGNAMASVAAAAYEITFAAGTALPDDWDSQFLAFCRQPDIPYRKTTKKSVIELNLHPLIYEAEAKKDKIQNKIYLLISAGSSGSIKPGFVLEAFFDRIHFQLPEYALCVCRLETYGNQGTEDAPRFVPLGNL